MSLLPVKFFFTFGVWGTFFALKKLQETFLEILCVQRENLGVEREIFIEHNMT
jgi:hypothetical protein